jgi:hypothetical protein
LKTERAGFEPAMEFNPHTRLAGECLQPLGHLSLGRDASLERATYETVARRNDNELDQDDLKSAHPVDRTEVVVLGDDGYPMRERCRGDPEIVHVQSPPGFGEVHAQ